MTRRLARYLEFFHATPVKVFNYNEYRRKKYGKVSNFFFDPTNVESMEKREKIYAEISVEVTLFMQSHPNAIAILDSTNATFKRRNALSEMIHKTGMCSLRVMFRALCEGSDSVIVVGARVDA